MGLGLGLVAVFVFVLPCLKGNQGTLLSKVKQSLLMTRASCQIRETSLWEISTSSSKVVVNPVDFQVCNFSKFQCGWIYTSEKNSCCLDRTVACSTTSETEQEFARCSMVHPKLALFSGRAVESEAAHRSHVAVFVVIIVDPNTQPRPAPMLALHVSVPVRPRR